MHVLIRPAKRTNVLTFRERPKSTLCAVTLEAFDAGEKCELQRGMGSMTAMAIMMMMIVQGWLEEKGGKRRKEAGFLIKIAPDTRRIPHPPPPPPFMSLHTQ